MILKQFSDIKFVKGYNRICIYDLSRMEYDFISSEIVDKFYSLLNMDESYISGILDEDEKKWLDFLQGL